MDLKNKVALVTGAARGLGKLYAEGFLQRGAKVCLADILEEEGRKTEEEFRQEYGVENVFFVHSNVTTKENLEGVFDAVLSKFGNIDVVVNNAGIKKDDLCIDLNLKAVMWSTEFAIERMHKEKRGKGGVIINIASIAGIEIHAPIHPYYTTSKFGVVAASRSFSARLQGDHGIRINTLCPSYVLTDMTKAIGQLPEDHPLKANVKDTGGWLEPKKCCDAVMKLVTDESFTNAIMKISTEGAQLVEIHNSLKKVEL